MRANQIYDREVDSFSQGKSLCLLVIGKKGPNATKDGVVGMDTSAAQGGCRLYAETNFERGETTSS